MLKSNAPSLAPPATAAGVPMNARLLRLQQQGSALSTVGGKDEKAPKAGAWVRPPLFLVGSPRSGTSLVYRALSLHPDAAYVSNWLRRFPGLAAVSVANRLSKAMPALQLKYWFGEDSNAYRYGARRSLIERAFPAPVEGGPVFEHAGIKDDQVEATPAQAAALRRAFASVARLGGGRTVVSKRIDNNGRIPLLADVFPDARFVNIVRDGRAVAYSLSRVDWWIKRTDGGEPWDLTAREWVTQLERVES